MKALIVVLLLTGCAGYTPDQAARVNQGLLIISNSMQPAYSVPPPVMTTTHCWGYGNNITCQ